MADKEIKCPICGGITKIKVDTIKWDKDENPDKPKAVIGTIQWSDK